MESGFYPGLKKRPSQWLEENGEMKTVSSLPSILQPQTPKESMEFLARSWSLSAKEVSKALAQKQKQSLQDKNPNMIPETETLQPSKIMNSDHGRRTRHIGKWFHNNGYAVMKKDRVRAENAHIHAAVSVAGLAAALAAVVAAADNSNGLGSKMGVALASATELLASHCVEIAELAGADHDRVSSVVRSSVDIRSPGDLMTLTASAATALRGEATLRARLPRESRKNSAISPHDRSMEEDQSIATIAAFHSKMEERSNPYKGELLQPTRKGVLQWKCVSVYINKKSQVIIKLKSRHVRGAFSKKKKCVVYGVCGEAAAWPFKKERETMEEVFFGLKTAQGFLEFKCKSKIDKQKWVEGIRNLLLRVSCIEATTHSLEFLNIK